MEVRNITSAAHCASSLHDTGYSSLDDCCRKFHLLSMCSCALRRAPWVVGYSSLCEMVWNKVASFWNSSLVSASIPFAPWTFPENVCVLALEGGVGCSRFLHRRLVECSGRELGDWCFPVQLQDEEFSRTCKTVWCLWRQHGLVRTTSGCRAYDLWSMHTRCIYL